MDGGDRGNPPGSLTAGWVRVAGSPWSEATVELAGRELRLHRRDDPRQRRSIELARVASLDELGNPPPGTSHLELRLTDGTALELTVPPGCRDALLGALLATLATPPPHPSAQAATQHPPPHPSAAPTQQPPALPPPQQPPLPTRAPSSPPPLPAGLTVPHQRVPPTLEATEEEPLRPEPLRPELDEGPAWDDRLPAAPVMRWGPPVLPGGGSAGAGGVGPDTRVDAPDDRAPWGTGAHQDEDGRAPWGSGDRWSPTARAADRRHAPARRRRHPVRWMATVALAVVALVGADLVAVHARIERFDTELPAADDGVRTWLLVGSDSRAAAVDMPNRDAFGTVDDVPGERADVVLLVQEGHDGRPPQVVSVPRDLLVFRRGHGVDRLALSLLDGPSGLVTSVCRSLGVPVDHVVRIRFDGLRELVEAVGGIDVRLDAPARDLHTGLDLPAGSSRLDGAEAIAWLRSRHLQRFDGTAWITDPSSDTGRQERQREVLEQVTSRMASRARNPVAAHRLAWTASDAIATDGGTGPVDLARLASSLRAAEERRSLPHSLLDGRIPVAQLTGPAQDVLDGLRSETPDGPPCPRPKVATP